MFIDLELNHNELFEEDLEGNLTQRIMLGAEKAKKLEEEQEHREQKGEVEEGDKQAKETREAVKTITTEEITPEEPTPSTSKAATFVPTDILTENIASGYLPDDEESDAETISSTSTADYDCDEAEELVQKIFSCHSTLSNHYIRLCNLIPHMSKTQLELYLGKILFTPLVKAESGAVQRNLPLEVAQAEDFNPQIKSEGTADEKLQDVINQITADRVLFMIAIGDLTINKHSQWYISKKYDITLSSIQRMLSGNPEHKKGGRQYQVEKKRKAKKSTTEEEETEGELEKKKPKGAHIPEEKVPGATTYILLPALMAPLGIIFDEDEELPSVNI